MRAPIISCQSHHCICFYFIFVKHIRDMKERLQQLLQDKKLSANKLAEMLGIQPSGISHILAGRNKPSIDFVTKLLLAFPDLNPDWFILGTGSMCRTQSTAQPSSAAEAAESATSTSHQPPQSRHTCRQHDPYAHSNQCDRAVGHTRHTRATQFRTKNCAGRSLDIARRPGFLGDRSAEQRSGYTVLTATIDVTCIHSRNPTSDSPCHDFLYGSHGRIF